MHASVPAPSATTTGSPLSDIGTLSTVGHRGGARHHCRDRPGVADELVQERDVDHRNYFANFLRDDLTRLAPRMNLFKGLGGSDSTHGPSSPRTFAQPPYRAFTACRTSFSRWGRDGLPGGLWTCLSLSSSLTGSGMVDNSTKNALHMVTMVVICPVPGSQYGRVTAESIGRNVCDCAAMSQH